MRLAFVVAYIFFPFPASVISFSWAFMGWFKGIVHFTFRWIVVRVNWRVFESCTVSCTVTFRVVGRSSALKKCQVRFSAYVFLREMYSICVSYPHINKRLEI